MSTTTPLPLAGKSCLVQGTRVFLWIAVFAWAIGLGGKLFDLVAMAGAWSAAPPESLKLMPYGPHYAVDPGRFLRDQAGVAYVLFRLTNSESQAP